MTRMHSVSESPSFSAENEWKYRPSREILVFLHISKTAGSTVRRILQESFGQGLIELYDSLSMRAFTQKESIFLGETFANCQCMTSHNFCLPLKAQEGGKVSLLPFTFLRNPVERVISEYYYALSRSQRGLIKRQVPNNFIDWFQKDLDNKGFRISSNLQRDIIAYGDTSVALTRIKGELLFTGITERFDESLVLLRQILSERGYILKPWILRQNETNLTNELARRRVSDRVKYGDTILNANLEDQLIYESSMRMLDRAIENYRGDFERDLHFFRLARTIAFPYYYCKGLSRRAIRKIT